jgi:hypothetical protein
MHGEDVIGVWVLGGLLSGLITLLAWLWLGGLVAAVRDQLVKLTEEAQRQTRRATSQLEALDDVLAELKQQNRNLSCWVGMLASKRGGVGYEPPRQPARAPGHEGAYVFHHLYHRAGPVRHYPGRGAPGRGQGCVRRA